MTDLKFPGETSVKTHERFEAYLSNFAPTFDLELLVLAGDDPSPQVQLLAESAMGAARGACAMLAIGTDKARAAVCASVALELFDAARDAAARQGGLEGAPPAPAVAEVGSQSPLIPPGGSTQGAHASKSTLAPTIAAQRVAMLQRLDILERVERAKAVPSAKVLTRLAMARSELKANEAAPPTKRLRGPRRRR